MPKWISDTFARYSPVITVVVALVVTVVGLFYASSWSEDGEPAGPSIPSIEPLAIADTITTRDGLLTSDEYRTVITHTIQTWTPVYGDAKRLAESFCENLKRDAQQAMERYYKWADNGGATDFLVVAGREFRMAGFAKFTCKPDFESALSLYPRPVE